MAEVVRISVEGLESACSWLDGVAREIAGPAVLKGLTAGGDVIARELRIRTPEQSEGEHSEDKPHLSDSIVVEVVLDSSFRGGYVDIGFGRMGHVAWWVEFGHRMIGHAPKFEVLKGPKTPEGVVVPQPFMRPTTEAAAVPAVEAFVAAVEAASQRLSEVA